MAGIEVHIPYVNFKTKVQGFPRRVNAPATELTIQEHLQYYSNRVMLKTSLEPLNTTDNQVDWEILDGNNYCSIDGSTGELTIDSSTITQMVKVRAKSRANANLYEDKEIVLTHRDVEGIEQLQLQILFENLASSYTYANDSTVYSFYVKVQPNVDITMGYEILEGTEDIEITNIQPITSGTHKDQVLIQFKLFGTHTNSDVKIRFYDADYPADLYADAEFTAYAPISSIFVSGLSEYSDQDHTAHYFWGNEYSFSYSTSPSVKRNLVVECTQNNDKISVWNLPNGNLSSGTIGFTSLTTDSNTVYKVKISDPDDENVYKEVIFLINTPVISDIVVTGNTGRYTYNSDENVYNTIGFYADPSIHRPLRLNFVEGNDLISWDVSNRLEDSGDLVFRVLDPSREGITRFLLQDSLYADSSKYVQFEVYRIIDSIMFNNLQDHYFYDTDNTEYSIGYYSVPNVSRHLDVSVLTSANNISWDLSNVVDSSGQFNFRLSSAALEDTVSLRVSDPYDNTKYRDASFIVCSRISSIQFNDLQPYYAYDSSTTAYSFGYYAIPNVPRNLSVQVLSGAEDISYGLSNVIDSSGKITFNLTSVDKHGDITIRVYDPYDDTVYADANFIYYEPISSIEFNNLKEEYIYDTSDMQEASNITYSFGYYAIPDVSRNLDVSVTDGNENINWSLSNVRDSSGQFNFNILETAPKGNVSLRVSDPYNDSVYADEDFYYSYKKINNISFNINGNHRFILPTMDSSALVQYYTTPPVVRNLDITITDGAEDITYTRDGRNIGLYLQENITETSVRLRASDPMDNTVYADVSFGMVLYAEIVLVDQLDFYITDGRTYTLTYDTIPHVNRNLQLNFPEGFNYTLINESGSRGTIVFSLIDDDYNAFGGYIDFSITDPYNPAEEYPGYLTLEPDFTHYKFNYEEVASPNISLTDSSKITDYYGNKFYNKHYFADPSDNIIEYTWNITINDEYNIDPSFIDRIVPTAIGKTSMYDEDLYLVDTSMPSFKLLITGRNSTANNIIRIMDTSSPIYYDYDISILNAGFRKVDVLDNEEYYIIDPSNYNKQFVINALPTPMGNNITFNAEDYYENLSHDVNTYNFVVTRANAITYDTSILYDYITSANTIKAVQKGKAFVFSIIDSDIPVSNKDFMGHDTSTVLVDSSKYLDPSVHLYINVPGFWEPRKDIWFRIYHPVESIDISTQSELYDSSIMPALHNYYSLKNNQYFPDEALFGKVQPDIKIQLNNYNAVNKVIVTPKTNRFLHFPSKDVSVNIGNDYDTGYIYPDIDIHDNTYEIYMGLTLPTNTNVNNFDWNIINYKVTDPIDSSKFGIAQYTTLLDIESYLDASIINLKDNQFIISQHHIQDLTQAAIPETPGVDIIEPAVYVFNAAILNNRDYDYDNQINNLIDSNRPAITYVKHPEYFNNLPNTVRDLIDNPIQYRGYVTNRCWDYYDNEILIYSYSNNAYPLNKDDCRSINTLHPLALNLGDFNNQIAFVYHNTSTNIPANTYVISIYTDSHGNDYINTENIDIDIIYRTHKIYEEFVTHTIDGSIINAQSSKVIDTSLIYPGSLYEIESPVQTIKPLYVTGDYKIVLEREKQIINPSTGKWRWIYKNPDWWSDQEDFNIYYDVSTENPNTSAHPYWKISETPNIFSINGSNKLRLQMQISNPQWYQNGTGVNARDLRELNNMCFGFRFMGGKGDVHDRSGKVISPTGNADNTLKFKFMWRGIQDN